MSIPPIPAIVTSLRSRGVLLWVEFEADRTPKPKLDPADLLTPADWEAIKADREAVIEYLVAEQQFAADCSMDFFQRLRRCGLALVERNGKMCVEPASAELPSDQQTIADLGPHLLALIRSAATPTPPMPSGWAGTA